LAIAFVLIALSTGLVVLSTEPALATTTPVGENRASGSAAGLTTLIGIEARLSEDAVRENIALGYEIASDDAVAARGTVEGIGFARSQLQHAFKHAKDFGVSGNASNRTLAQFSSAINSHVSAPGTRAIQGTFRGTPVTHHVDPSTGLNVIRDSSGNFLSGWRLSPQQLENVLTTGRLGGGP
jgi:hypothetical protein